MGGARNDGVFERKRPGGQGSGSAARALVDAGGYRAAQQDDSA